MNFIRLLDYNKNYEIQTELAYLIIRIIEYASELYFKETNIYNIRKFDYLILYDEPYIDEKVRIDDNLDLIVDDEAKEQEKKEANYDAQEAFDSLDIDDYENDGDVDESMQALEFENFD